MVVVVVVVVVFVAVVVVVGVVVVVALVVVVVVIVFFIVVIFAIVIIIVVMCVITAIVVPIVSAVIVLVIVVVVVVVVRMVIIALLDSYLSFLSKEGVLVDVGSFPCTSLLALDLGLIGTEAVLVGEGDVPEDPVEVTRETCLFRTRAVSIDSNKSPRVGDFSGDFWVSLERDVVEDLRRIPGWREDFF